MNVPVLTVFMDFMMNVSILSVTIFVLHGHMNILTKMCYIACFM